MWSLTLRSPGGKPQEFMIVKPRTSIGRRADNDIVVADISASRLHAELNSSPSKINYSFEIWGV
jgi:pSer/pThr/pTyr-binding forkhead associated (FHA) protein